MIIIFRLKCLSKVSKILVKRAREEARNTAKRIIMNHTESSREDFDKEISN